MFKFVETEAIATQLVKVDPDRGWRHRHSGKVREIFESADGQYLLLVATDRISAFDVVMNERIPDKGRVLNLLSAYWFGHFSDVPNHLIGPDYLGGEFAGRASLVLRTVALPVEVIFRALITGSFWADFQKVEATDGVKVVHGIEVPTDM